MPDGTPRKLLDVSRIKQRGWEPKIELEEGIKRVYDWYIRGFINAVGLDVFRLNKYFLKNLFLVSED